MNIQVFLEHIFYFLNLDFFLTHLPTKSGKFQIFNGGQAILDILCVFIHWLID